MTDAIVRIAELIDSPPNFRPPLYFTDLWTGEIDFDFDFDFDFDQPVYQAG